MPDRSALEVESSAELWRSGWWFISALGLIALFLALSIQQIWSADLWWQLRTGQWILEHQAFPRLDEFSYTVRDHEWIELRWVFCVLAYWGWEAGGAGLLIIAQAAILASAFWIIVSSQPRAAISLPGVLLIVLGIGAGASRFLVRPEIITYLMMSIFLVTLHGSARGKGAARVLVWLLPILQVIWVNSHTLFVFGPIIAWVFAVGAMLQNAAHKTIGWPERNGDATDTPLRSGTLTIVAILVSLACLVNPYGWRGAAFPLILIQEIHKSSVLGTAIEEFRSPFQAEQTGWALHLAAGLVIASLITFMINWRRIDLAGAALWAAFVYLLAVALRNVGMLAFVATWAGLVNLQSWLVHRSADEGAVRKWKLIRPWVGPAHVALGIALIATAWQVAANRLQLRHGVQSFGVDLLAWSHPVDAVEFLQRETDIQPNIFHDMADASWLIWQAHERIPVFVDGRLEVYGEEFLGRHLNMSEAQIDRVIGEQGVNVVLIHTARMQSVAARLMHSPGWALVHLDPRNLVFVRDIPEHAKVIAKWRIDPQEPWSPRGPEPDELIAPWQKWLGTRVQPMFAPGMVRAFLAIGSIDNAEVYARRGLEKFPDNMELRLTLAQILRSRGRSAEADSIVAGLDLSEPAQVWANCLLAELLQREGRWDESTAPLEEAMRLSPNDGAVVDALAKAQFAKGDFAKAGALYGRLAAARPDNLDYQLRHGLCCEKTGDRRGAIEAYQAALRIDPSQHSVHNQLGTLLAQEQDMRGALAAFTEALRLKPDYEPARKNMEFLQSVLGGGARE